jgi:drug/metabolite transporter (DMT)-like permease
MLGLATARGEWQQLTWTPRAVWAEVYLIVVGSLGGYSAYLYALKHLPISTVSLYAYINPVIAVLLGAIILGEIFNFRVVIASAIVLAGVAVVKGTRRPK